MFKKLIALLKDKARLYEIVFGSETPTARKFDLMVIIAISVSLIVMFVESLQIVDGRFKFALEIIEGCLTVFFTVDYLLRLYCSPVKRDYQLLWCDRFSCNDSSISCASLSCSPLYAGIQGIQVYQGFQDIQAVLFHQ